MYFHKVVDDGQRPSPRACSQSGWAVAEQADILRSSLNPPGAVAQVLNHGEQVLYRELVAGVAGNRVLYSLRATADTPAKAAGAGPCDSKFI